MTVTRFRTSLVAVAFAAMAGLTFFGPLVTSGGPVAADAPREAELNRAATVLEGPVSRNNRVQASLILDALVIDDAYRRASVNRADGSLFAESGEAGTDADTFDLPVGPDGATLRVEFAPVASAEADDGAVGPMAYLAPLGLLAALLAGAGIAALALRARHRKTLAAARERVDAELDRQKQMFASLTEAYNDLVIDHTMHTHQRQLERRRFFADIEKQKAELIAARDAALGEAMARSRFFASMTHELRTPMNAIMGFSEAIEKQIFGPHEVDRYSDYARDIHVSAQHLLDTINHLLDMAKAESGKLELDDSALELEPLISGAVAMLRPLAETAKVTLSAEPAGHLPPYQADQRILRQILINLISNAIKFTPTGGAVHITASADAADDLVIAVRDNGPGIPGDELANVFEPFVQGSLRGSGPGTGLGLPLSRTFARLHGGELLIESTLGEGTTALLYMPSWRWRRMDQENVAPLNIDAKPAAQQRATSDRKSQASG